MNGASADDTDENDRVAESSNTAWQMLLPVPPDRENSVTDLPDGEVSVPTRSPTKVWSMPTVVEPSVAEQLAPSTENFRFDAPPTPVTGSEIDAPVGSLSGMASGAPV